MMNFDVSLNMFYSTLINDDAFFSGFTTKAYGDMRSREHIYSFFSSTGLVIKAIVLPEQMHSANLTVFNLGSDAAGEVEKIEETDAVVTKEKQTVLAVRTADCVPVIFADKKNRIIAISHQGWRGSLKRLVQNVVTKMREFGSSLEDVYVSIGPSINDCCYDVDEDRYYQFLSEFNGYSHKIFLLRKGKRYVNLAFLNYLLLIEVGIQKEHIDHFPFCTSCDKKRFYSFRRDNKNDYGNMINFIVRN